MISSSFFSISKRPGATLAGIFSLAFSSVFLLCGAGLTPTGNVQKSDINANGYNLTNAATVQTTNVYASVVQATNSVTTGTLTVSGAAALPSGTTVGGTPVDALSIGANASGHLTATTGTLDFANPVGSVNGPLFFDFSGHLYLDPSGNIITADSWNSGGSSNLVLGKDGSIGNFGTATWNIAADGSANMANGNFSWDSGGNFGGQGAIFAQQDLTVNGPCYFRNYQISFADNSSTAGGVEFFVDDYNGQAGFRLPLYCYYGINFPSGFTAGNFLTVDGGNAVVDSGTNASSFAPANTHTGTPTITVGAGAGTGGTASLVSGSTDTRGGIQVVIGTSPTAGGIVATVTFHTAYAGAPYVFQTTGNSTTTLLSGATNVTFDNETTTTFQIVAGTSALPSGTYLFKYLTVP